MTDFLAIARHNLLPLSDQGFTFWDEKLSRGEVRLECDRRDVEIRVCYEPFGPPWCDLRRAGKFERSNIEIHPQLIYHMKVSVLVCPEFG